MQAFKQAMLQLPPLSPLQVVLLHTYHQQCIAELDEIVDWWSTHMQDDAGVFHGRMTHAGAIEPAAVRGLVLYSRLLWTYSAAYSFRKKASDAATAHRLYQYLRHYFFDPQFGGFYWSVDCEGKCLNDRKQTYGQAFALYAISTYASTFQSEAATAFAMDIFACIEQHCKDLKGGGYIEAFARNFTAIDDLRLSDKDANVSKSMNTHLHVLEAYSSLYHATGNQQVRQAIIDLLQLFQQHIVSPQHFTQHLFFDDDWQVQSHIISYGHDIEASWLLHEAACCTADKELMQQVASLSVSMAAAAMKGVDDDGGMWYEQHTNTGVLNKEKHWWPQAEAMVGFMHAYCMGGNERMLEQSVKSWLFICKNLKSDSPGEWHWGIDESGHPMHEDRAGFWKCPYHNSRACIETAQRIGWLLHR
ncbi:MAG: AGE family epimerase/isomerase [Chitinophagaceae bacterium]|nr:AGE family epimerase/isomerase [Chitinophagaceae bacterium]